MNIVLAGAESAGLQVLRESLTMPDAAKEAIQRNLLALFSDILSIEVPSPSADLFETGILDSQSLVELLLHIERQFDTRIITDDFELDNFRCIEKIAALILRQKNAQNPV